MSRAYIAVLAVLAISIAPLSGCMLPSQKPSADPEIAGAHAKFQEKRYAEALTALRKVVASQAPPENVAYARYQIAVILGHAENPQKSYTEAIAAFDEFLKRHPGDERVSEALSWKATLKNLMSAQQENEQQRKSIEQLKGNLNQLKQLDVQQEKKRRR